jgi:hypothetical protein
MQMKYFTNTTKRDKKAPSPNRVYLAPLRSAQIQPDGWTSDTLETLSAIVSKKLIRTNLLWKNKRRYQYE